MDNRVLGKLGEDTAAELLRGKGYRIMHRNYRCNMGEVDIIASRGAKLCFIEVKTRMNRHYGRPCEAVNNSKQQHIRSVALCYLKELKAKGYVPGKISFDVMEIMIDHIEGAF